MNNKSIMSIGKEYFNYPVLIGSHAVKYYTGYPMSSVLNLLTDTDLLVNNEQFINFIVQCEKKKGNMVFFKDKDKIIKFDLFDIEEDNCNEAFKLVYNYCQNQYNASAKKIIIKAIVMK